MLKKRANHERSAPSDTGRPSLLDGDGEAVEKNESSERLVLLKVVSPKVVLPVMFC